MADYICREAVLKAFKLKVKNPKKDYQRGMQDAIDCLIPEVIAGIPATDVMPARYGHWISSGRDNDYNSYCRCSRCDHELVMYRDSEKKPPNYCENCGADMRGNANG